MPGYLQRLGFDSLESRVMLSAAPVGNADLVNDLVIRVQSAEHSDAAATAIGDRRIVVFEGKGFDDAAGVFAEVTDASGAVVRSSFRVNTTTRGEQLAPSVAVAEDGSFIIAWAGRGVGDKLGVFFQRFDRDGVAVESETLANETFGGKQSEPAIAVAADRSFVIAWSGVGTGDVSGVFFRRFSPAGGSLGSEVLVNTETANQQSSPSIAFDESGDLVVAWQSRHQDGSDWGVYAQGFDSASARIGSETRLNATTEASQSAPSVAANSEGGVVVAWQSRGQDGNSWDVVARAFDETLTPAGDEVLLNATTEGHQERVAIAIATDGQWLTAWSSGRPNGAGWEAVSRNFESDGVANDEVLVTAAASGINSGHQRPGGLAVVGDAATVIWTGNGDTDHHGVYAQEFAFDVDNGVQQSPNLAPVASQAATVGQQIEILVTATDPNPLDTLAFLLDTDTSPSGAVLEQIGPYTARIRWTPPESADGQSTLFRVLVVDDGEPPLADSEDFFVMVAALDAESAAVATADEAFASFE